MNIKSKLRNWLAVNDEIEEFKKFQDEVVTKLRGDLEFWHQTFRAFSVIPCAYCKKQMRVYPYGGAYYHIEDNKKVHADCYDEYLKKKGK